MASIHVTIVYGYHGMVLVHLKQLNSESAQWF